MEKKNPAALIKKGLDQGFNLQHIQEVLVHRGYQPKEIELASRLFEHKEEEEKPVQQKLQPYLFFIIIVALVLLFVLYLFFQQRMQQEELQEILPSEGEMASLTGEIQPVLVGLRQEQEKITLLFQRIDALDDPLLNLTGAEKEARMQEYLEQMQEAHQQSRKYQQELQELASTLQE